MDQSTEQVYFNPFDEINGVVVESPVYFTGREDLIKNINSLINKKSSSNLAIIGEQKMGKKSLIYQTLIAKKGVLNEKGIFPIEINVGIFQKPTELFAALVKDSYKAISNQHHDNSKMLDFNLKRVEEFEKEQHWGDFWNSIKEFFQELKATGFRFIFILKKFDKTTRLFGQDISFFQSLAELISMPGCRQSYIIVSRRTIRRIEESCGSISDLHGLFPDTLYVRPFSIEEIHQHLSHFKQAGVSLSENDQGKIISYCGGYPYLINILCKKICDLYFETKRIEVDNAYEQVSEKFEDLYYKLIELLKEDDRLDLIYKITFGPAIGILQAELKKLISYGLIIPHNKNGRVVYKTFSQNFEAFLKDIKIEDDFLLTLQKLKVTLRKVFKDQIKSTLTAAQFETYGKELEEQYLPQIKTKLLPKDLIKLNNISLDFENLVELLAPEHFFHIMMEGKYKSLFSRFFPPSDSWNQKVASILEVWRPYINHQNSFISKSEGQLAQIYCGELLDLLKTRL